MGCHADEPSDRRGARLPTGSPSWVARSRTTSWARSSSSFPVLKGSYVFAADLVRHIDLDLAIDFLGVRSYGDQQESSGVVQITTDLSSSIEGKHVILVEDIVDTGLTVSYLYENLGHPSARITQDRLLAPQTRAHPRIRRNRLPRLHRRGRVHQWDTGWTTRRSFGICPTWPWSPTKAPKRPILPAVTDEEAPRDLGRTDPANRCNDRWRGRQAHDRRSGGAFDPRYGGTLARSDDGAVGPKPEPSAPSRRGAARRADEPGGTRWSSRRAWGCPPSLAASRGFTSTTRWWVKS